MLNCICVMGRLMYPMIRVCVWWENQNCNESMYGFVLFCTWTCAESLRKKAGCREGCKQSVEGWCQTEWYRTNLKRSSTITCFWPKALGWLMGQSQRERERERLVLKGLCLKEAMVRFEVSVSSSLQKKRMREKGKRSSSSG